MHYVRTKLYLHDNTAVSCSMTVRISVLKCENVGQMTKLGTGTSRFGPVTGSFAYYIV